MTTRNKLAFVRHSFARLLSNLQDDEEIVVIDGASTDGTKEFFQNYHAQGKIHQFLSERDKGEAHGWNKGLLMARGELVRFITDDDVFHYPTIRRCKEYMLSEPTVDLLGSDGGLCEWGMAEPFLVSSTIQGYERWVREGRPFFFHGPGIMVRRRSLSLLGLIHTGVLSADEEYCRRVSSLPVNMAWCSHLSFVWIRNATSNSVTQGSRFNDELPRIMNFYNCDNPYHRPVPLGRRITAPLRWALRPIKRRLLGNRPRPEDLLPPMTDETIGQTFARLDDWLDRRNAGLPCTLQHAERGSR